MSKITNIFKLINKNNKKNKNHFRSYLMTLPQHRTKILKNKIIFLCNIILLNL